MRTSPIVATLVALLCATTARSLFAQAQQPPARTSAPSSAPVAHHGVAVIDIKYIMDKYARLQQGLDRWKKDRDGVAQTLQKEAEGFQKQVEKLKSLKPGSNEFKALEEELAKKDSDQKIKVQLQEKDFTERRAKLYLAAYQDITDSVKNYADRNGISLVLQFNGAPIDQNNPQAVQAEVLKFIVYQNGIDITPIVLDDLNRRAAAGPVAQPPSRPATRQR